MRVGFYSFIIPVFNRPDEIRELLESLSLLDGGLNYEVIIVEDGSDIKCEDVCSRFRESVPITYYYKPNSGPGDSRNYGMTKAKGDYFIILDSDCIIPSQYLIEVDKELKKDFVDCYGGPDAAQDQFTDVQKAINYSMTSFLTTGGIRGGSETLGKFQPRSFNMGLSKEAFLKTEGFGKIHPGEDPDLTIRLWKMGFKTRLFKSAFVYHKRRISFASFFKQVQKFGKVRVILNKWHPETRKLTYWFPSFFVLGFLVAVLLFISGFKILVLGYVFYLLLIFVHSVFQNGLKIGFLSIAASCIQFYGYGIGYLIAFYHIKLLNREEREIMPQLFFK